MDLSERRLVRTPGSPDMGVEPIPEAEGLLFLLSHSFPGHRRVVRPMSATDRKNVRLAIWTDSTHVRISHVDRMWGNITEPVLPALSAGVHPSDPLR